jgi:hypothetical protein
MTTSGEAAYEALEQAITILRDEGAPPIDLASALYLQSVTAIEIGRSDGDEAARECYAIGLAINHRALQNVALNSMARWALTNGDLQAAAAHLAEARRVRSGLNAPVLIVAQAYVEAMVARVMGDIDAALRVLSEGADALRLTRSRHFAAVLDSELAHTLRLSGDLDGAASIYRRTILEWQDMGRQGAVANQLENFAFIAVEEEKLPGAARLFGAAEALRERLDDKMLPEERQAYEASVASLRQKMDPAALQAAWQAGRELDLDSAVSYALTS